MFLILLTFIERLSSEFFIIFEKRLIFVLSSAKLSNSLLNILTSIEKKNRNTRRFTFEYIFNVKNEAIN